ncbi:hypothetical protein Xcel_3451 (plasmid) [Xylanimonas cellulosilytica DSM 15894]|uniref:Integral membrane protein n=1 Tax=Xylanimonas cellulosilytica (strain DSM 15894 / JCM 12276 / CECT 5975 / KCTC 9989 / LMG 20990 / NBRC 107835 / XIL07) TaxID=446471 RepID=D1C0Y4_XYLCX|nr:hypothetical protein Xcel_3451 [Xylanimonas cellulosilytica DSM 15894]
MGRGPSTAPAPHRVTTWTRVNAWTGYLILGLPAALALPALAATITKFGLWATLTGAAVSALAAIGPVAAWTIYTRRRPSTRRGAQIWLATAAVVLTALWVSPLFFWTGPVVVLLVSELARALFEHRRRIRAARLEEA